MSDSLLEKEASGASDSLSRNRSERVTYTKKTRQRMTHAEKEVSGASDSLSRNRSERSERVTYTKKTSQRMTHAEKAASGASDARPEALQSQLQMVCLQRPPRGAVDQCTGLWRRRQGGSYAEKKAEAARSSYAEKEAQV